jgi:hypothetical protein
MAEEKSTYLLLTIDGQSEPALTLEFLPTDPDIDGIWVRTNVTTTGFVATFDWFLATVTQGQLASVHRDLAYRKDVLQFELHDTDCSFAMKFKSTSLSDGVEVGIEVHHSWPAGSPAVSLDITNASAPLSEVSTFLDRLSRFG